MKNKILALGILAAVLVSGCGNDQTGIKNKARYERIVSTSPASTEILFALGLEEKIAGVTTYCNYPSKAKEKPKIGGYSDYSLELIVHLNPDLVLASSIMAENTLKKLKDIGIKVILLTPKNIDEILENIIWLGNLTGREKEAKGLVQSMKKRIDRVKENARKLKKKPRVIYILWHRPLTSAGKETFANDLIEVAGGENICSDLRVQYPRVSLEFLLEKNPEIIITGTGMGNAGNLNYETIVNDHRLKNVDAVKNGRVYRIDGDLVDRPGPRIVNALEQFAVWIQE